MSENVIEIDNLVVEYRGKRALDGLTLKVARGQVFGFLGPNGAGKSTAIKTLLGLVFARSGLVRVHGRDPSHPAARALIGYLPEEATYYRFLTPVEILHFYGTICGVPPKLLKSRIEDLLGQVGLWPVRNRQLGTFSKGMNQKVGLAQCLIHDPQ
ncbi:MAG: ABC transporter ATP-binding protein, partial [Candidatus Omnitrophota bacterium]